MTSEAQLGRSVLETKERAELQTIAEQLSVKSTSRMKKADLISGILTAAGVGDDASSESASSPSSESSEPKAAASAPIDDAEDVGTDRPRNQNNQNRSQNNNRQGNGDPGNRRNNNRRRGRGPRRESGDRDLQGGGSDAPYQGELVECRGLLDLRDEG